MAEVLVRPEEQLDANTYEYAQKLDREDPLGHLRAEFIIPTKADLKSKTLAKPLQQENSKEDLAIYLCGNSLGLQPRRLSERISSHLSAWARKGVFGHFIGHEDSDVPPFLHIDDAAAEKMAPVVGALKTEVAVMETLTANLHLLMSSFYRPTKEKYKIIIEGKAFPSDRYAVESQIRLQGFDPKEALVVIEPPGPSVEAPNSTVTVSTSQILATIEKHASTTALILLPGIQFYTGQYFDIKTITAYAHSKGLLIGWDLAHAVGNVDVHLHDWDVDFAAWCTYKYMNSGPGAMAALFVHERHGKVDKEAIAQGKEGYRPRLCGWWGGDKSIRFQMNDEFIPIPGAAGFQVGNSSALGVTAVLASLETFALTSMEAIRAKSVKITGYLQQLLVQSPAPMNGLGFPYCIITPFNPAERGAQLSLRLAPGLLDGVMAELQAAGVVVDERQPDVIRVAPAPLYNTYKEVWEFVKIFREACDKVRKGQHQGGNDSVLVNGPKNEKGWGEITS